MNNPFYFIAVLTAFNLPAQSQVLGVFEQGAADLKEYGQQIAALELLLTRQQEGYRVVESGLTAISAITGTEYNLHQHYFTSLDDINPAVDQIPEIPAFFSIESQTLNELTAALTRWHQSQYLSSKDNAYVTRTSSFVTTMATRQLLTLYEITSDSKLTMTDDQRVDMISKLYTQIRSLYVYTQTFIDDIDLLIINRKN
jgi:hypothetical protein